MTHRKLATLVLGIALTAGVLSGCTGAAPSPTAPPSAAPTLTPEEAERANTISSLLERYKTVTYAQLDYIGGSVIHETYFTDADGNYAATEESDGYQCYSTDALEVVRHKGAWEYTLFADEECYVSDTLLMVADSQFTSQAVDASGNLVCETVADIDQDYADDLSGVWKATTDDKMVTTAVFAPDDFRVLTIDFSLRRPDGSEEKIAAGVMLYDLEVAHAEAVQNYLDAPKHEVTLHLPDNVVRVAPVADGEPFTWKCDEGYALYLDEAGTQPLPETADPVTGALTLYCLPTQ